MAALLALDSFRPRPSCKTLLLVALLLALGSPRASAESQPAATKIVSPLAAPSGPSLLRVVAQSGEVLIDKGGNGAESTEPLRASAVLARSDELSTNQGSLDLVNSSGSSLRLSGVSLVALLSPTSLYLARGDLLIVQQPPSSAVAMTPAAVANPPTFVVATPCGRFSIKGGEARLRTDGNATALSLYAGSAVLPSGAVVAAGQAVRCSKGEPIPAPRPMLAAATWIGTSSLTLRGDSATPTPLDLKWQPVASAVRYRVDLSRSEGAAEIPVSSQLVITPQLRGALRPLAVGSYLARVYAVDSVGAVGQPSLPQPFLTVQVGGMAADGVVRSEAGRMPRISAPAGVTWSVLIDGAVPSLSALKAGSHQLRILIAEQIAEVGLLISGPLAAAPPPRHSTQSDFQGDSQAVWIGQSAPSEESAAAVPVAPPGPSAAPVAAPAPRAAPAPASPPAPAPTASAEPRGPESPPAAAAGPDDVLLGGVGEVPFDGVRSPWATTYVGSRIESTTSGSLRLSIGGRYALRNGFGFDLSASVLRAAIANLPTGQEPTGFGNIHAAVRTPALRTPQLALQGLLAVVAPLSNSFLDSSVEQDAKYASPGDGSSALRAGVRPAGGGWRIEPALLLGIRRRGFSVTTTQGLSLRVSPDFGVSYAGGLLVRSEITPILHFVTFAVWEVHYLGGIVNPVAATADLGGAVGGGLEALIPAGELGKLRLMLLGRVGIGDGGEAIYGRGAVGLQVGYRFQ